MLTSIFSNSTESVELLPILISSVCSIILGVVISLTHKFTSKYNKSFLCSIAVLPLLVQTIIIMVNGNLGTSVAILGAFSLVRFRSLPGNSKEIVSVFFAMTVGLATGMGQLLFAGIITLLGCIALITFNKVSMFNPKKEEKILKITIPENLDYTSIFDDVFAKYVDTYEMEEVKTTNMGSLFDIKYKVVLKKNIAEKEFIDELRVRNGNMKIILSHPIEENNL